MNSKLSMHRDVKDSESAGVDKLHKHLKYRPDIDGLRAFAIITVVLFHAFPSFVPGGFIGVDIFFVISGYLISSIIFKELNAGSFSFSGFYQRRIKRIFPALVLVLAACYIFGWFALMASEFKMLGKHMISSIGFVQNIVLYKESGYFDTASELKPLLHLWSLGVEEQFYFLFPLIAWAMWRYRKWAFPFLIIAAVVSFGADVHKLKADPSAAFYLPQYRFWEILVGSLLAYAAVFHPAAIACSRTGTTARKTAFNAISLLGVLLLIASVAIIDKSKSFPGAWALMPVMGSALLILSGPNTWLNDRVLASRVFVGIGLISYPLYLWHWPVITFMRIVGADELSVWKGVIAITASFLLAFVTYKFIELPFRAAKLKLSKTGVLVFLGCIVAISGTLSFYKDGLPGRAAVVDREEYAQYFNNYAPSWNYFKTHNTSETYRYDCDFYDMDSHLSGNATNEPKAQIAPSCYTPTSKSVVMVWGDSHAQQLLYGLKQDLPSDVSLIQVASSGCVANIPNPQAPDKKYCDRSNTVALEVIHKVAPQILVIAQIGGHDMFNNLAALVERAKGYGVKHVIVVGPVPRYNTALHQMVIRKYWFNTPKRVNENFAGDIFPTDTWLKKRASTAGFEYVSALDAFCNSEGCMTYVGDDRKTGLVTFDVGHLTSKASEFFARTALVPVIVKDLATQ
ncbi:acyltransferase family protein [Pseudomonas sp. MF7453]|uniref:acyltransferase family protein n=1 Tax=Pseudomonas sp. MF7453 TaxID=2797539 RepID=UPI0018E86E5E|nr:acyltransferase family protein [Pseudomonas sp. MF7453]MBJ2221066.1 acyltransferase [Pseudomonas sp. MF7453]